MVLWLPCEHGKFDIQSRELKTNYHLPLFQPTHFRYFCRFFTISISILISIFHFVSISRSTSIFWISRFQDQYQYLGKSNFEINIKINMTNILKNIGKSIYCPIPDANTHSDKLMTRVVHSIELMRIIFWIDCWKPEK